MDVNKMPELKIGNLIAKIPIVQGGMGVGISLSGLASAVANQGGIGVISSVGLGGIESSDLKKLKRYNIERLREEIRVAKEKTKGIIGVNIMQALTDFDEMVIASLEEEVDIIFVGAGLPLSIPGNISLEKLQAFKSKIIPIVSSARAAKIIFRSWDKKYQRVPDGVVVEGPKAGGHLGFKVEQINDCNYSLEKIVPEVISEIKVYEKKYNIEIPVIAGGGIYTGEDICKFLKMGVQGVQMGTRFVATDECDAAMEFKEAYIKAQKKDVQIIDSPVGLPGRAIIGDFLNNARNGLTKPLKCYWKCLRTCDVKQVSYCIAIALINAQKGLLQKGFAFAGANVYRVKKIVSVKELIQELILEYTNYCKQHSALC
jgi:NAD(P)H-dependent flavin oxidoreductase YrpB (nitropropane dioxygenase family)